MPPGELVVWRGSESHHLRDVVMPLSPVVYDPADREIFLTPRFLCSFLGFWMKTQSPQQAATIAFLRLAKTRVICMMENFDIGPLNRDGLRWSRVFRHHLPNVQLLKIQHGLELRRLPHPTSHYGTLAVWGQYSADWYPSFGRDESSFVVVGSLKDSRYRTLRRETPLAGLDAICIVSTVKSDEWWGPARTVRRLGYDALMEYVAKFATDEGQAIAVALTIDRDDNCDSGESDLERNYFTSRLGQDVFFPDVSKRLGGLAEERNDDEGQGSNADRFSTYALTDSCKLTIGAASSVLWEAFGRGNRILAVNLTDDDSLDFGLPGPWFLKQPSFEQFSARCRELMAMTDEEYRDLSEKARQYLMYFNPEDLPEARILQLVRSMLGNSLEGGMF